MKKISIAYGSIEISDGDSFVRMPHQDFKEMEDIYEPIDREYTSGVDELWEEGEYYLSKFEQYRTIWLAQNAVTAPPSIKWKQFRMFFLSNIAYNRMRFNAVQAPGQIAGGRIEAFMNIESTEWEILAGQWNVFIAYTPVDKLPSLEEVNEWKAQAASALMPFTFSDDGKLILIN